MTEMTEFLTDIKLPRRFAALLCLIVVWVFAGRMFASAQIQVPVPISSWSDTYGKSPADFTVEEWRAIIDTTWGEGIETGAKQLIFDRWWNEVNLNFGSFLNLDFDIQAFKDQYRPEIQGGVSRGRFAAIMNHFGYRLKELHTYVWDTPVRSTPRQKGVPLLWVGQWGSNPGFGAVVTPLADSSLVVYEALPNHPIGLEAGDIVLGYDGVLWKDLWPRLVAAELPLVLNSVNAGNDEGNWYYHMQAVGLNWHLFDTIDIVKYASGDTLHFDTNNLIGERRPIWGRESLDVPGVEWPDRQRDIRFNWGMIDGTNVGYIVVTSWNFAAQYNLRERFRSAIDSLMHEIDADGIIIDQRFNTGGGALAREGFNLLFNETVQTVGFEVRAGTTDHLSMAEDPARRWQNLVIQGDPDTFYDKPIAGLIGPGSISAGELEATRLSFHPRARLFGRPSPASYSGSDFISLANSDWFSSRTSGPVYLVDGHVSLSHIALQPDEWVWFDRDDIVDGKDTVVQAALDWIASETALDVGDSDDVLPIMDVQVFPNPSATNVTFDFNSAASGKTRLAIFDLLGREIADLDGGFSPKGSGRFIWTPSGATAPGVYFYRLESGGKVRTGNVIIAR